jgi:hypothetical protein
MVDYILADAKGNKIEFKQLDLKNCDLPAKYTSADVDDMYCMLFDDAVDESFENDDMSLMLQANGLRSLLSYVEQTPTSSARNTSDTMKAIYSYFNSHN